MHCTCCNDTLCRNGAPLQQVQWAIGWILVPGVGAPSVGALVRNLGTACGLPDPTKINYFLLWGYFMASATRLDGDYTWRPGNHRPGSVR